VADAIVQPLTQAITSSFGSMGGFGPVIGGFLGAGISALFGGLFGGKKNRGESTSNPIYVFDTNNERERLLSEMLNVTKAQRLQQVSRGNTLRGQMRTTGY